MGTPEVAVPLLNALHEISDIRLVVTQPDRPSGRKRKLQAPPVKVRGNSLGLPVIQPERIKRNPEFLQQLKDCNPDVIVVVAYGKILPETILSLPPSGCVNVHYSLLPAYRGAAPVNWALVNGEKETGVTLMKMDKGLDTGPIIAASTVPISLSDDAPRLFEKLTATAIDILKEKLPLYLKKEIITVLQDEEMASYAPIIRKEDGKLDFSMPAMDVYNRIRGFQPWPGGFCTLNKQTFKFLKAGIPIEKTRDSMSPGTVTVQKSNLFVACGDSFMLPVLRIQPENRKAMDAASCLNGGYLKEGDRFEAP